jgi:hypothetical protein
MITMICTKFTMKFKYATATRLMGNFPVFWLQEWIRYADR